MGLKHILKNVNDYAKNDKYKFLVIFVIKLGRFFNGTNI